MRRGRVAIAAVVGIGCSLPHPAQAADPAYGPPSTVCTVTDPRLAESSGLAVDGSRLLTVNDGGDALEVFVLDGSCRVTSVITSPADPYDVEDLARAADGTLWLADTGDNDRARDTVALHALREDGQSVLFRFTYPDGPHDAEALLLDAAGRPYLLTKDPLGRAGIYTPSAAPSPAPSPASATPLERVGELSISPTGTPGGPVGALGQVLITGAATSPDGALAVVRTYTDAYVYAVPDGDVLAALATEPVQVALPAAAQGEAIAFGANSRDLVVSSEGVPFDITLIPALVPTASTAATASPTGSSAGSEDGNSEGANLAIAAVLAAVVVGVYGVSRRRH